MTPKIEIPQSSLVFRYSRSSGPGGQNVNKLNTKVTLLFDLACSDIFSDIQKNRILKNLPGRIDKNGLLSVTSQKLRTQDANRRAAVEKLEELLAMALKENTVRKKTNIPQWARQKRIERKRRRSVIKGLRAAKDFEV